MASLRGYPESALALEESAAKAVAWHEKRAEAFVRMSENPEWPEAKREDFRLWAEAERRNAEGYRTGQIRGSVIEALRSGCP